MDMDKRCSYACRALSGHPTCTCPWLVNISKLVLCSYSVLCSHFDAGNACRQHPRGHPHALRPPAGPARSLRSKALRRLLQPRLTRRRSCSGKEPLCCSICLALLPCGLTGPPCLPMHKRAETANLFCVSPRSRSETWACSAALDQTRLEPFMQICIVAWATLMMSSYTIMSCLETVSARRRRRQRFNAESDGEDYSESEKSRSARSTPERSSYEERPARSDSEDDSDDGGQFQVSSWPSRCLVKSVRGCSDLASAAALRQAICPGSSMPRSHAFICHCVGR